MKKISSFPVSFVLIFILFSWSCRKEQYNYKGIPEVETTGVEISIGEGAHFRGRILAVGETEVLQHGFSWSTSEMTTFDQTFKVFLGPAKKNGIFDFTAKTDIVSNQTYYLRAFLQTNTHLVFGEMLTFKGEGSSNPEISSVTPAQGLAGDTVVIKGRYFSSKTENNKVLFNSELQDVFWSDEDEVRFVVPFSSYGMKKLAVQVSGVTSANSFDYEVIKENLTLFEPSSASFGDTLILYGDRLSTLRQNTTVFFNDAVAEITEITSRYYKVIVPSSSTQSTAVITIKNWGSSSYTDNFVLKQVVVDSVSPGILFASDTLTLYGSSFNINPSLNRVTIGGKEAIILISTRSSLRLLIPWTLEVGIYDLSIITIDDQPVTYNNLIEVRTQWKRLPDFPGLPRSDAATFVIGDNAYVGTGRNGSTVLGDIWEYNGVTGNWSRKNDFVEPVTEATGFTLSDTGYMATFKPIGYKNAPIYAYDSPDDRWEHRPPLPISEFDGKGAGFVINGSAYVMSNTFTFSYTPGDENWDLIAYINSFYFWRGVAFTDGIYGYFGIGMEKGNTNTTQWYRYNPSTNIWETRAVFPGEPRNSAIAFFLPNGKGYVGLGYSSSGVYLKDFWEYDPSKDRWKRLADFPGEGRASAASFNLRGQGYVFAGNNGADLRDLWFFDPNTIDF